jgi:hypothetical protein
MKKIGHPFVFNIVIALIALGFFSCEREQDFPLPGPQLEVDYEGNPTIVQEPMNEVILNFFLQATAGLNQFVIRVNGEQSNLVQFEDEFSNVFEYRFMVPAEAQNGDRFELDFELSDQENRIVGREYTVLVQATFSEEEVQVGSTSLIRLKGRLNNDYEMISEFSYLIDSTFSVENNATLRIEAGTTLYFQTYEEDELQSRLVIGRGSRIEAIGTADRPIVFTSIQVLEGNNPLPTDWAGVFLYGNAPSNQGVNILDEGFRYGGNQPTESSGRMSFCRIEYAGKNGNHGLHLFGVGSGTRIDHIQVFDNENIAFRVKGGNVSLKWIAGIRHGGYGIWAEHGWQGNGQFWIFQTNRAATLVPINFWNQARSIEMRNDENFFLTSPRTQFNISNVTLIGNGNESVQSSGTRRGIRIRRGALGTIQNAIITQFPDEGVRIEDLDLEELGEAMVLANTAAFGNRINYAQEAESFFLPESSFQVNENPVPGISPSSFVGSRTSNFNPATLGSFFSPAPYLGAVESNQNDWTSEGSWFKSIDGTIR